MNQAEYQQVLNQIPWHSLQDVYGPALLLRTLLEKIASSSSHEEAWQLLGEMDGHINHQEVLEDCALDILPALIALAQVQGVQALEGQLYYLSRLLWVSCLLTKIPGIRPAREPFWPDYGINPLAPEKLLRDQAYHYLAYQIRDKLAEHRQVWISFLDHPNPLCRSTAARFLALLNQPSHELFQVLQSAYEAEQDPEVQASFLISLGVLFHETNDSHLLGYFEKILQNSFFQSHLPLPLPQDGTATMDRAPINQFVNNKNSKSFPGPETSSFLVQASAAIATVFVIPTYTNELIWQLVEIALSDSTQYQIFSCWEVGLAGLAAEALTKLGQLDKKRAIFSLIQGFTVIYQPFFQQIKKEEENPESIQRPQSQEMWKLLDLAETIAQHLFLFAFQKFQGRTDEVLPEELDEIQQQILTTISYKLQFCPPAQSYCGIPLSGTKALGRYLGILPPGPLDRYIELKFQLHVNQSIDENTSQPLNKNTNHTLHQNDSAEVQIIQGYWPLWKWIRLSNRKEISEDELVEQLLQKLTTDEIFSLSQDLVENPYQSDKSYLLEPDSLKQKLLKHLVLNGFVL